LPQDRLPCLIDLSGAQQKSGPAKLRDDLPPRRPLAAASE
jgi:hypothetical protein